MSADKDDITFHPPIDKRPTSELLAMVGNTEDWQPFARALAESVLRNRGIDQEDIDHAKTEWAQAAGLRGEEHVLELARRKFESYSIKEVLIIFLGWPLLVGIELASHHLVDITGKGLWTLSAEKRWLKFWERCALIPASLTLYGFVLRSLTK